MNRSNKIKSNDADDDKDLTMMIVKCCCQLKGK